MNYILALIFGVLLFLLFPVFLNVNIFVDVHARKMYFSFYVLRLIKIYGGYATLYDEGIAFHLTKNKAVLLPYREIINTRQKFEITRGFYVFAYSHTLEVGTEDASRAVTLSALAQIVSGIVAGYIFSERKCVSFKTDLILYANKRDAVYLPTSIEVIVCRVTPTDLASASCEIFCCLRSSLTLFFNIITCFAKLTLHF